MDMLDDFSSGDEETTSTENHPEAVDTVLPKNDGSLGIGSLK
jgi:putative iron-dependent peroxidase